MITHFGNACHGLGNRFQGGAGGGGQLNGVIGDLAIAQHFCHRHRRIFLQYLYLVLDFLSGLLSARSQCPHFIGHHGKPPALFAGPRRFNGGIECEQIGLFGHTANHVDNGTDALDVRAQLFNHRGRRLGFIRQPSHRLQCVGDNASTLGGFHIRVTCRIGSQFGILCNLLRIHGHLFYRRGDLFGLGILFLDTAFCIRRGCGHLLGRGGYLVG